MKLEGKVAIITGSGSGIGRATAERFALEGARVVVADINPDGGIQTVNGILKAGGEASFVQADVSQASDCEKMVHEALERYGGVDVLHNNAAFVVKGSVLEITEGDWDQVMAVTLKGVFLSCKAVLPTMVGAGRGVIINTASIAGIAGVPTFAAYCAAKGGVVQLTRSIACDYGPLGIRANVICPGIIETPATSRYLADPEYRAEHLSISLIKRIGKPEDIASAALFLASDDSSFMTGAVLTVDAGKTATSGQHRRADA